MISYQKGGNILLTRGLPDIPVEDTDAFKERSYKHFCEVSAPRIIRETYVPALNKFLESSNVRVKLVSVDVRRKRPLPISYCRQLSSQEALRENETSETDCIYGKFALEPATDEAIVNYAPLNELAEEVELCSIPYVKDGLVIYDRYDNVAEVFKKHAYNFIQQVELIPSISLGSKKEVTIRCKSGKSLVFYLNGKGSLHVKLSKKRHMPFAAIAAYYGFQEAHSTKCSISQYRAVRDKLVEDIHYYGLTKCLEKNYFEGNGINKRDTVITSEITDKYKISKSPNDSDIKSTFGLFTDPDKMIFPVTDLRGALNQYLSLYRAEGLVAAYDVTDKNGNVVVEAGKMLTKEDITEIYNHDIFYFHVVQERPTSVYMDEPVIIRKIPKGTRNSSMLRKYLPTEIGMYISRDYDLPAEQSIVFPKKTEVTETIWQFLQEVNYTRPIMVRSSLSSKTVYPLYLNREIYSNFFKPDGTDKYENWTYVGPFGSGGNANAFTFGDMIALYTFLPQVLNNLHIGWLPDADACFLKHFTTIDQMFSKALEDSITLMFRTYTTYLRGFKTNPESLLKRDSFNNKTWHLYGLFVKKLNESKCLELVDEKAYVNPLAYESAKHKANVYVGNKHAVSEEQRRMALTSYGRFDAYEVPQSGRLGIVNYLTTTCKQTDEGVPMVLYYPIENMRVRMDKPTYLTAQEEANYIITDIGILKLNGDKILNNPNEIVNCRVPSVGAAKSTIEPQRLADVQFVNADPDCTLGFVCGTIPFSCSNDAVRATFAVAQIKEAKPTENTEKPGVTTTLMTKLEQQNNPFCIKAKEDGVIVHNKSTTTARKSIYLECVTGGTERDHNRKTHTYSAWADLGGSESISRLRLNQRVGVPYKKGDVLCCSQFVDEEGHICLGMNTPVVYISDGYNYEDGVSITPAYSERSRSLSIHSEDVYVGKYRPRFVPSAMRYYKRDDVIEIAREGKVLPAKHTLTECGYFYEQVLTRKDDIYTLTVYFMANEPAHIGDKFADRDGNKGVVTHICSSNENYTFANGYPIEVLRNPLGVATRLNIGQIRECRLSWVYKILNASVEIDNFSHDAEDIDTLVNYVYDLANSDSAEAAVSKYRSVLPADLIQRGIEQYGYAQQWRGVFDTDGACDIYLNGEKRPTKAYGGFIYMLKLIQEVGSKVSYRAGESEGERYMSRTNSPTKGRKSGGGQRLGSMEVAAYCAYGAENWLNEMFKYRSDDGSGRLAFAMDKYYGDTSFYQDMTQRRSVTELVTSLAGLGIDITSTEHELIDAMSLQGAGRLFYPKLNSIREEMSFTVFNKPKVERVKLQEDTFDDQYYSETEMENIPIPPDIVTHEELMKESEVARYWLYVFLQDDAKVQKYLDTYKKRAGV